LNSVILALAGFIFFFLGYRFYSKFIADRIFCLQEFNGPTPAEEFEDGIDFVPTEKYILFGHHFTSIAGAAPIIGPCIAVYWGWLPAFLWIIFGTIFMGAVHDFGTLVTSVREKGKSIADLTSKVINSRTRIMFLIFVLLLVWLVLAVFAMVIAGLFVAFPITVLPVNIEIFIAMLVGWQLYRRKLDAFLPSLLALVTLYIFIYIGTKFPLSFESFGLGSGQQNTLWIILLFIYSAIASLLPVWFLLQPRDYINSHQLFVGLSLLFIGLFVAHPVIDAPAFRSGGEDAPSIFPLLFVTIACGAISGFHGLVSSGTTSKQIKRMHDTRFIGYGAMLGEGILALASTLAAVAGIALVTSCSLPSVGIVDDLSWANYYDTWGNATANKAAAFVLGGGAFIQALGIPADIANGLMAVLVISFAATTLDTATRIQRFIITELGEAVNIPILKNRYMATAVAVIPAILLALWNIVDPSTGASTQAGWVLWPIFGASNQMLAALTLMVLLLYSWSRKKPVLPLAIPFAFISIITLLTLIIKAGSFMGNNRLLFGIDVILIILILWMLVEGMIKLVHGRDSIVETSQLNG